MSWRRFAAGFGCVMLCAAMAGMTCNGGGGLPGAQLTDDQFADAFAQVDSTLAAHFASAGSQLDMDAVADALRARSELHDVEIVNGAVWAKFPDGENFAVINNRFTDLDPAGAQPPDSAPTIDPSGTPKRRLRDTNARSKPSPEFSRTRLPTARTAHLVNAMGTFYEDSSPLIQSWLETAGYVCTSSKGTVEDMRNIKGAGVLYMSSHGATHGDYFALWTSTKATREALIAYRVEAREGKLTMVMGQVDEVPPGSGKPTIETHIAVTDTFIQEHWRLAEGALVYMDACFGFDANVRDACLSDEVKAGAYIGWDKSVQDACSTGSSHFFFDRVLGANASPPFRSPPQRPFPASAVIAAMSSVERENGLMLDESATLDADGVPESDSIALLNVKLRDGFQDSILRPTIMDVRISELGGSGGLIINGDFGSEPGSVSFGGSPIAVKSAGWTPTQIQCERPAAATTGDVVVQSGTQVSNPRRVTGWDMRFDLRRTSLPGAGCQNCMWDATYRGFVRADAGPRRTGPERGVVPARVPGGSATAGQTVAIGSISGSYTANHSVQYQVTITHNFPSIPENIGVCLGFMPIEKYVGLCYDLDVAANKFTMQPSFIFDGGIATWTSNPPGGSQSGDYPYWTDYPGTFPGNEAPIAMDAGFNLSSGQRTTAAGAVDLQWTGASAVNPPDPAAPK